MPLEEAWILAGIILKNRDEFLGDRECGIDVWTHNALIRPGGATRRGVDISRDHFEN